MLADILKKETQSIQPTPPPPPQKATEAEISTSSVSTGKNNVYSPLGAKVTNDNRQIFCFYKPGDIENSWTHFYTVYHPLPHK